ncbi:MAG: DEAD/DEAH box helicase [Deltaproteobacteria bacterium]|nr:DEAD/DEAH box helicase [Deltaproteobacteria bacterium]
MDFKTFNFCPSITAGIEAAGYQMPTPIQRKAIPAILKGQDVMGLAQTGTGKTAAFVLPILERLSSSGRRGFVQALIVAPTRELAEQINENICHLGMKTGIRSMSIYGGVNIKPQIAKLARGVEIIVACPGRLLDHLQQKTVSLARLEILVLDEADHMFDMGFFPDIKRIMQQLPKQRQSLLFSATMPKEIRHLAREVLAQPVTIQIGITAPADTVTHAIYPVAPHLKTRLLLSILKGTTTESVLIFTRTKHRAKRIGEQLVKKGLNATSIQGNLSQNRRQEAISGFRDGTYQILVATDIAARGIDVSGVSHVINYDIPNTPDAYIHRIGRTGRATHTGEAFTFVTDDDIGMVRAIERVLGARIESKIIDDFDYDIPAPKNNQEFARPTRRPTPRNRKPFHKHSKAAAGKSSGSTSQEGAKRSSARKTSTISRPRRGGSFRPNRSR